MAEEGGSTSSPAALSCLAGKEGAARGGRITNQELRRVCVAQLLTFVFFQDLLLTSAENFVAS